MLDAWGDHPAVRKTLDEASAALGQDLASLIHNGPKEDLALTTNTQPVMLVAGVAAYRAWRAEGGQAPAVVAGHSLGEYAALVAAEVLTLADAVPLVRLRAQAMQEAVPVGQGAMAAILGLALAVVVILLLGERVAALEPGLLSGASVPLYGWPLLLLIPVAVTALSMAMARWTLIGSAALTVVVWVVGLVLR